MHALTLYQTFLEAVRARYGTATHFVFITFGLFTNILVTAMLLTGGSAVVSSLTGVPTAAACFLLPLGVVIYTMFGGIKATFLTDYVHTVILLVIILTFAFTTYATGDRLGSPRAVYDALTDLASHTPVEGNAGGSYLTMRSKEGAIFFVINIIGNFGTVFMDNGYYNKAIAASPVHALPGYIIGGTLVFRVIGGDKGLTRIQDFRGSLSPGCVQQRWAWLPLPSRVLSTSQLTQIR